MKNPEKYIITIKAENRSGLLNQITGMLSRKHLEIESITAAKTDIQSIVLVTIELEISERALAPLLLRLENIIEVFIAEAQKASEAICHRLAFFKLSRTVFETSQAALIQKHSAQIINISKDHILIAKTGTEANIQELLTQIDGPHLIGISRSGLIAETTLMDNDDYRVIALAA